MELSDEIVAVWPLAGFDKTLHYRMEKNMAAGVSPGALVRIPVVRRYTLGVVVAIGAEPDVEFSKLKRVSQICYDDPTLTPDLLELAEWMRIYYGVKRESVLETMIPSPVRRGMAPKREKFVSLGRVAEENDLQAMAKRAPKQKELYEFVG